MRHASLTSPVWPPVRGWPVVLVLAGTVAGTWGCLEGAAGSGTLPTFPEFEEATGTPGETVGAVKVTDPARLPGGPAATARAGDYLLYNDMLEVVIADIPHAYGFAETGGNILDAALRGQGNDQLAQLFTYLDDTFPRQLVYDRIYVTQNGSVHPVAEIVVTGHDSANPRLLGVTRYLVEAGRPWVRLVTEITNTGTSVVKDYELGDSIQWGMTEHYVPGYGTGVSGRATHSPWVAGIGEGVSYGLSTRLRTLAGPHGSNWSDMKTGTVDLSPGGRVSYERTFHVGTGDTESIAAPAMEARGDVAARVTGRALEMGSGAPVAGTRIEARSALNDRPAGIAITDTQGRFTLTLPPSEYLLSASHRARGVAVAHVPVDLTRGTPAPVTIELTPPSTLMFRVEEAGKGPIPCKLTFRGVDGTPDPDFGHPSHAPGSMNVYYSATGQGSLELPPGRYQVTVSRGIEYGIRTEVLTLPAGEEQVLAVTLVREVDTSGYLAADFNQLSRHSSNAWVEPDALILANLAEGVEIIAITDIEHVTDLEPLVVSMGFDDRIKVFPGQQMVSPVFGSINVFPMVADPSGVRAVFDAHGKMPRDIFDALSQGNPDSVFQINQPREGDEGYFNLLRLDPQTGEPEDPAFSFGFHAIEVFSGKRMKNASVVLRDWFLLLNRGYAFTATGNSNSRRITTQERGYPRNYIGVDAEDLSGVTAEALATAVRDSRNVVVTNGPFIRLVANDVGRIGSMVPALPDEQDGPKVSLALSVDAPGWIDIDEIEIVANGEVIRRLQVPPSDKRPRFQDVIEEHPESDTWYVVIVRGYDSLEPVVTRYKGTTITPFAFTNPIWVDVDGDGAFTPRYPARPPAPDYRGRPIEYIGLP